jgi:hypothetical protein
MTDKEIISKMKRICELSQELESEAKLRYGAEGQLFLETNALHLAEEIPNDGHTRDRQSGIIFTAFDCRIESGAW